jgi:hypothetical protein
MLVVPDSADERFGMIGQAGLVDRCCRVRYPCIRPEFVAENFWPLISISMMCVPMLGSGTLSMSVCQSGVLLSQAIESGVRSKNSAFELKSIFDHDADRNMVEALRAAVVEDLHALHSNTNFGSMTAADLDPEAYGAMRDKYRRILHYGVFSLPGKRAVANELIWKWTEATGKYVGCQFWSIGAKSVFDQEVQSAKGWPITVRLARMLERKLSKKSRPNAIKLTHEHVYPIKEIKLLLASKDNPTKEEIRELLERQCMSCVLLESEHDRSAGHDSNPWLRYKKVGDIRLANNPAWLESQRKAIIQAGLL